MKRISDEEIQRVFKKVDEPEKLDKHSMYGATRTITTYSPKAVAQAQLESCEKEHDRKVQEIFEEIEQLSPTIQIGQDIAPTTAGFGGRIGATTYYPLIRLFDWQALKQKYVGGR